MSDRHESRLTQSFLGLSDEAFHAVPALEKALADTLNKHIDTHHVSGETAVAALACLIGEIIVMTGNHAERNKQWFLNILDAYVRAGKDGARTGPDHERSLIRRLRPWRS